MAVPSSRKNYPNPLYEGESADSANKSAYPKTFQEPLTFELYEKHQQISEAASPEGYDAEEGAKGALF